jgi:hypothetical protein
MSPLCWPCSAENTACCFARCSIALFAMTQCNLRWGDCSSSEALHPTNSLSTCYQSLLFSTNLILLTILKLDCESLLSFRCCRTFVIHQHCKIAWCHAACRRDCNQERHDGVLSLAGVRTMWADKAVAHCVTTCNNQMHASIMILPNAVKQEQSPSSMQLRFS